MLRDQFDYFLSSCTLHNVPRLPNVLNVFIFVLSTLSEKNGSYGISRGYELLCGKMFLHWNKKFAWAWLSNANNLNDSSGKWESSVLALLQMITVMREWRIEEADKIKKRWDIEEHTLDETTDGKKH